MSISPQLEDSFISASVKLLANSSISAFVTQQVVLLDLEIWFKEGSGYDSLFCFFSIGLDLHVQVNVFNSMIFLDTDLKYYLVGEKVSFKLICY